MIVSKTVAGLTNQTTAGNGARKILTNRFAAVTQRLKPARDDFRHDDEHIHQLRVSSRRADAALRLFADYLPGKRVDEARGVLRKLRRAAGPARDWDVFRNVIVEANVTETLKHFLFGIVTFHRHAVQQSIDAAVGSALTDWPKLAKALLAEIDAPRRVTLDEAIAPRLEALIGRITKTLAHATPKTPITDLHRLRILGKRLRYTLELAVGEQAHPKMLKALEDLQDILGDWHDAFAAKTHLMQAKAAAASANGALHSSTMTGLTTLVKKFEQQEQKQARLFAKWLTAWNTKVQAQTK